MPSREKSFTSVWFWMWAIFVLGIPCVGFFANLYWAFSGENESRKNYFKARLVWTALLLAAWVALMCLGLLPSLERQYRSLGKAIQQSSKG